jgi:uncharacterized membrane protein
MSKCEDVPREDEGRLDGHAGNRLAHGNRSCVRIHGARSRRRTTSLTNLARGIRSLPAHLRRRCHLGAAAVGAGGHRARRAGVGRIAIRAAAGWSVLRGVAV